MKNERLQKEVEYLKHELEVSKNMLDRLSNENSYYKMKLVKVKEAIGSDTNEKPKTVKALFDEHLQSL